MLLTVSTSVSCALMRALHQEERRSVAVCPPPLPHGWRCLRRVLPTAQAPAPRLVYRHQPAWAVLGCAGLPGNTGQLGNLETWEPELRPHMPDSQNLVAWCEPDSWTSVPVVIRDTNMCQCTLVVKPAHLTLHSKSYIF